MEATIRSNLSVGPPIDIQLYEADSLALSSRYHFTEDSEYLQRVNRMWHERLLEAFAELPPLEAPSNP